MAVIGSNKYGNITSTGGSKVKRTTDPTYKSSSGSSGQSSSSSSGKSHGPNPDLGPSSGSSSGSSKVESRVIYEPDPNQPGGSIAKTIIDTKGRDVKFRDVKTGKVQRYKASSDIKASEVSIPEKGILSYQEQKFEKPEQSRVVTAKTESGKDVITTKIDRVGDTIRITDSSGVRYVKGKDVRDISTEKVKSYQEQREEEFEKTGRFKGSLLDYQEYVAKSEGRITRIDPETARRAGVPVIQVTSETTPKEFKAQRDIALAGYGDKVLVQTGAKPKKIEEGLVNYPPSIKPISEIQPAPKVSTKEKIKGKIETGIVDFLSKGQYKTFEEMQAYATSGEKVTAKDIYNIQRIPAQYLNVNRLREYGASQTPQREADYAALVSEGLFKPSPQGSSVKVYSPQAIARNPEYQPGKDFAVHNEQNALQLFKDIGISTKNLASFTGSSFKERGSQLLANVIEYPATAYASLKLLSLSTKALPAGVSKLTESAVAQKAAAALPVASVSAYNIAQEETPSGRAAAGIFDLTLLSGFYGASKIKTKAQDVYVAAGSEYVAPENVFAESVLSGKETLPTTRSVDDALKRFSSNRVSTAAPQKLSSETAGVGKKAATGYEDPGIYVTPSGEGSPYFLRLSKDIPTEYELSLNPLKGGIPTVTEFEVAGVTRYPREVINRPGFYDIAKYQQEKLAGSGQAVITKRLEVGLGEVRRRPFIRRDPLTGEYIRRSSGEAGTSEIEAVIPLDQTFRYNPETFLGKVKGFEKYTKYANRNIAIREAELLKAVEEGKLIKGSKIKRSADYLYELERSKKVYPGSSVISGPLSSGASGVSDISGSKAYDQINKILSSPGSKISYKNAYRNAYPASRLSTLSESKSYNEIVSRILGGSSNLATSLEISSLSRTTSEIERQRSSNRIFETINKYTSSGVTSRGGSKTSTPGQIFPVKKRKKEQGFDILVRIRGKDVKVNTKTYSKLAAISKLKQILDATAAASGKVQKSNKAANIFKIFKSRSGFYTKGNRIIEKAQFRISTVGEKKQITQKGLAKLNVLRQLGLVK